jgi:hypothetical protein
MDTGILTKDKMPIKLGAGYDAISKTTNECG